MTWISDISIVSDYQMKKIGNFINTLNQFFWSVCLPLAPASKEIRLRDSTSFRIDSSLNVSFAIFLSRSSDSVLNVSFLKIEKHLVMCVVLPNKCYLIHGAYARKCNFSVSTTKSQNKELTKIQLNSKEI